MRQKSDTKPRREFWRALLKLASAHRGLIAGWLFFLALSSTSTLVLPFAVRQVIDHGFSAADIQFIDRYFMFLLGVAALLGIASAARFFFITTLGEKASADLRQGLYRHLLKLDLGFYESAKMGDLLSRLSTDIELVQIVLGSGASVAVRSFVTLVGAAVLMVLTDPRLASYAALIIPLVLLPMVVFGKKVRKLAKDNQDRAAAIAAYANETLSAIPTMQAYVREPHAFRHFSQLVGDTLDAARKRIAMRSGLTALVIVLVFGAVTAVLWLGARAVIHQEISPGTLSQFVLYAVMAAGSVGALGEVWSDVQRAMGAMERIQALFDIAPQIKDRENAVTTFSAPPGDIRFDNVTFHYPTRPNQAALDHIDLRIAHGENVALVGPSGAGKSTLFQLLLRFHDPLSGNIVIGGVPIRDLALATLRETIAIVPQEPVIFNDDVLANVRFGKIDASEESVIAACKAAEAHEFIMQMPDGYSSMLGERGIRLSGGQKQRLAIARAILKDAPILLLDEATSNLDAQNEAGIQQALERLMQKKTSLVIAHRLATVLSADRIVVMDQGRIIATGKHAELLETCALYAELARLQFSNTMDRMKR